MVVRLALFVMICLWPLDAAVATPARVIILRHGEKADSSQLCEIGQERANALATNYLGRKAAKSLFAQGEEPSGTYDYFWIVEYGNQGSDVPTRFNMVKQELSAPYNAVPSNDWDQPNGLEPESGCDLKGAKD
jgi:hypothetical protein